MASANINIDAKRFEPNKQTKKRRNDSSGETTMEIDNHNGAEPVHRKPNTKRLRSSSESKSDIRKISVPAHRYTPLKENWLKIFTPIVEHLKLQVRFNLKTRNVEIKACDETQDIGNLQKAADFVKV